MIGPESKAASSAQRTHLLDRRYTVNREYLFFYLLWPIILSPKELQLILLTAFVLLLLTRHRMTFDALSYFLYSYILIYAFSILLNVITRSPDSIRVLAAFNSLSVWILAFVLYLTFRNVDINMEKLKKIGFINYCILIVIWIWSIAVHSVSTSGGFSILNRTLYYDETFNQNVVARFVGLMEYSNLIVMFCVFTYPLFFMFIRKFKSKFLQLSLLTVGLLPLYSTYSRSGYAVIAAAIGICMVYYLYRKMNKNTFFALFFFSSSIMLTILFFSQMHEFISQEITELLFAREGSNDSRSNIMVESISSALNHSPIIGMGIKDLSSVGYPLGSHSTFVGFFYKTGFIGLLLGTTIFVFINIKILLLKGSIERKIMSIFLFFMPLLFLLEDIDGSNWLICYYFIFVALVLNKRNWILRE